MGPHAGCEHSLFSFQREFAEEEDFLLLPLRPTRHCECRTDRVRGRPAHGVHSGLLRRARNDVARLAAAAQRDFPQMQGKKQGTEKIDPAGQRDTSGVGAQTRSPGERRRNPGRRRHVDRAIPDVAALIRATLSGRRPFARQPLLPGEDKVIPICCEVRRPLTEQLGATAGRSDEAQLNPRYGDSWIRRPR